ncbi:uncharacterized protein LOC112087887 [Eutrema salsugineum]|uniref:uncharacterized protein LOC112087887 n=1 Tax=Eutrema salsugineum TaxID=72664 RepID=UPI000CECFC08|nr:uncharacterized protein LOC112087887 [Eutrema salsugineum]
MNKVFVLFSSKGDNLMLQIEGKPKIAAEVLEGMRQYLMVVNPDERKIREERIKSSLKEVEKDPIAKKTVLRLEPPPLVSYDINKGKGIVYDYEMAETNSRKDVTASSDQKLLSSAIKAGTAMNWESQLQSIHSDNVVCSGMVDPLFFQNCSTEYGSGFSEASPPGTKLKRQYVRKRPYVSRRKIKGAEVQSDLSKAKKNHGLEKGIVDKRKTESVRKNSPKGAKTNNKEMVPNEGPSNA